MSTEITDEHMQQLLLTSQPYTVVLLTHGPNRDAPDRDQIVWEHARRNFEMRAAGQLAIVCPVRDESDLVGVGIFTGTLEEVDQLMADDPGVRAGVFTYEVHPSRSFPGDALPAAPG